MENTEILKAIEASNKAFEEFKSTNDARVEKMEKGQHVPEDLKAKMDKVFADMSEQKAIIESLEAKMKRPQFGGEGHEDQKDVKGRPLTALDIEHKAAFRKYICKGQDSGLGELQTKAMQIGSGPDGGFAVPKVIDAMIEAIAVNISPIRAISQVVQTSTQDYHKLVNIRGATSGWVGETTARTETATSQFKDISPPMGDLYANPMISQQVMDDVFFNAEQWMAEELATEFSRAEGAAFITGTGINQPLGFLSGPAPVATADATRAFGTLEFYATGASGAFKTLTSTVNPADDLYTLVSKMKAMYRPGCKWVTNKAVLFQMMAFKDYQGRYVFSPTTAPGTTDTILGYPVVEAEDMPALAANSLSLAFGNFQRGYLIVDRVGTRVIRDPFSNKPYTGFYSCRRLGGSVLNSEAIKCLKFST